MEKDKLLENMELKLLKLKKDIRNANEKVDFLVRDINKLKFQRKHITEVERR